MANWHSQRKYKTSTDMSSENKVESDVAKFMQAERWNRLRMQSGQFEKNGRRITVGYAGMPDWLYTRGRRDGTADLLWFEAKAPGKKPAPIQAEVIVRLRFQGYYAIWADSLEMFKQKYEECGFDD